MLRISYPRAHLACCLGLAAIVTVLVSAASSRRAEAVTLINPVASPAAKAASDGLITEVRHGGGGHGGHFSGFRGGFHAARIGGLHAAPAYSGHRRIGTYPYGGYRYVGHPYVRRHHHFYRRYYGGFYSSYYPYYYAYPRYHRCRIIWTYYGPRRVCHWHRWYRWGYSYPYYW